MLNIRFCENRIMPESAPVLKPSQFCDNIETKIVTCQQWFIFQLLSVPCNAKITLFFLQIRRKFALTYTLTAN